MLRRPCDRIYVSKAVLVVARRTAEAAAVMLQQKQPARKAAFLVATIREVNRARATTSHRSGAKERKSQQVNQQTDLREAAMLRVDVVSYYS